MTGISSILELFCGKQINSIPDWGRIFRVPGMQGAESMQVKCPYVDGKLAEIQGLSRVGSRDRALYP